MNDVKLLHIKCCFFQFFNSPVALKNRKKICPPPQEKVEMTPLSTTNNWAIHELRHTILRVQLSIKHGTRALSPRRKMASRTPSKSYPGPWSTLICEGLSSQSMDPKTLNHEISENRG